MSSSTFLLIASVGVPTLVFLGFMLIQYADRKQDDTEILHTDEDGIVLVVRFNNKNKNKG